MVKVGDILTSKWDDDLKVTVVLVSPYDEVVYEYNDKSIGYADDFDDLEEQGFVVQFKAHGWINVIQEVRSEETYFDDNVYVTRENALNAFRDDDGYYRRLDTIEISWSTSNV